MNFFSQLLKLELQWCKAQVASNSIQMMLQLLVGDNNTVRGIRDAEGKQRFSVYDCLTILFLYNIKDGKEQDENKAANNARKFFSALVADDSEYRGEILANVVYMKFPGQGQRETPTMTLAGLQKLVLHIGGKFGTKYRELLNDTFRRVMAGDDSIIKEVQANAVSNSPMHQLYRESLSEEPAVGLPMEGEVAVINVDHKRKLEELEVKRLQVEIERQEIENHAKMVETHSNLVKEYKILCPNGELDEAARKKFMGNIYTLANKRAILTLTPSERLNVRITVDQIASELGIALDANQLISAKIWASKAYEAKYGEKPVKHAHVCTYTAKDRDLIEKAVKSVVYHP